MSGCKIFHNVIAPVKAESIATTSSYTSDWIDTSGWVEKVIQLEIDDAGTVDVNVTIHISNQDCYELNNKTCTTDDYESVVIVNAHTGKVSVRYDSDDVADLGKPIRAMRVFAENDEGSTASTVTVSIQGQS